MNTTQILDSEGKFTSGAYPKRDLAIVRGKGSRLWDSSGNEYIDCVAGQGVANLGHCHPRIVKALQEQSEKLITCPEIFYNDQRALFLEKLVSHLPQGLEHIFLCNSGAESVEGALKSARLKTGKTGIIATMRGFHGRTMGALSATWDKSYRTPFAPLIPGVKHVPYDNFAAIEKAIEENTAAVLIELIQGEGGVRLGSSEYFHQLRQLCTEKKILLIIDEVQTGFGRTGKWFACDHYGITPDILCLGKAIGGGIPMGAVALNKELGPLDKGSHGSTFGGNPMACAAALASLQCYEEEGVIENSAKLGAYTQDKIANLNIPMVRHIRGMGLMIGIELKTRVTPVLKGLMDKGVLALPAGPTVLRLLPPLVISQEEIDTVVEKIGEVFAEMA